jgi:hypothetical protein
MFGEAGKAAIDKWTSAGVELAAEAVLVAYQLGDRFDSGVGKGELPRTAVQIRPTCQQVSGQLPRLSREKMIDVGLEMTEEIARPHCIATPPVD